MTIEQLHTLVIPHTSKMLIRLDAVRHGVLDYKHIRQLGRELQCDEATIRRDIDKLLLPLEKLQELLGGRPYEQIKKELIRIQQHMERQAQLARRKEALEMERNHGTVSDALAVSLRGFFADLGLNVVAQELMLTEAQRYSRGLGNISAERWYIEDHQIAIDQNRQPVPSDSIDLLNSQITWLLHWLMAAEPQWDIRDKAIEKALILIDQMPKRLAGSTYAAERYFEHHGKPPGASLLRRQGT